MKKIYSVLVENRSGVLSKVAGLFSRRCFNIDSIAVGETDDPEVSCMTIVSSGQQNTMEQIEKQLKENPPVNEKMIRAMFMQMGRKPSEAQIKQVMKSMNQGQ